MTLVQSISPPRRLVRAIMHRTRGRTNGPVTRLMSPSDLGEILRAPDGPHRPLDRHRIGHLVGAWRTATWRPRCFRAVKQSGRIRSAGRYRVRSRLGRSARTRSCPWLLLGPHDAGRAARGRGAYFLDQGAPHSRGPPVSTCAGLNISLGPSIERAGIHSTSARHR